MTMTKREVLEARLGDWDFAYKTIADSLTNTALRDAFNTLISQPLDPNDVTGYVARLNASLALGRMVSANDRAAGTIAALLIGQGIKPTSFDYGDDT